MRRSEIRRITGETEIILNLELDGRGVSDINSGCGFLDHMLTLFASHGGFNLSLNCKGDTNVDYHHSVEDIGICLGQAFFEALGDKKGINRYGSMLLPMDEALIMCAVDLSGRDCLCFDLDIPTEKVGDFDTELVEEFFLAFSRNAKLALHIKKLDGRNAHHIIEGAFKAFARSMKAAVATDPANADRVPSTKGVL